MGAQNRSYGAGGFRTADPNQRWLQLQHHAPISGKWEFSPFFPLHFCNLLKAQLFQKPAPLPVRYLHYIFTKGLAITMLSHRYKITSFLNHIKLYNTPTIKNIAPRERCSPDYFHVLIKAERQHFCLMQCKSQKRVRVWLWMLQTGKHPSNIHVSIHTVLTHTLHGHVQAVRNQWIRSGSEP